MEMIKKFAPILLAALLATSAHADFKSGNELLDHVNADNYYNKGSALGYMTGVVDAYAGIYFCPPVTITGGQVQDIVRNYLTQNPSTRHEGASILVYRAIVEFFPCKKK
jgi:hypothetical protein